MSRLQDHTLSVDDFEWECVGEKIVGLHVHLDSFTISTGPSHLLIPLDAELKTCALRKMFSYIKLRPSVPHVLFVSSDGKHISLAGFLKRLR